FPLLFREDGVLLPGNQPSQFVTAPLCLGGRKGAGDFTLDESFVEIERRFMLFADLHELLHLLIIERDFRREAENLCVFVFRRFFLVLSRDMRGEDYHTQRTEDGPHGLSPSSPLIDGVSRMNGSIVPRLLCA